MTARPYNEYIPHNPADRSTTERILAPHLHHTTIPQPPTPKRPPGHTNIPRSTNIPTHTHHVAPGLHRCPPPRSAPPLHPLPRNVPLDLARGPARIRAHSGLCSPNEDHGRQPGPVQRVPCRGTAVVAGAPERRVWAADCAVFRRVRVGRWCVWGVDGEQEDFFRAGAAGGAVSCCCCVCVGAVTRRGEAVEVRVKAEKELGVWVAVVLEVEVGLRREQLIKVVSI